MSTGGRGLQDCCWVKGRLEDLKDADAHLSVACSRFTVTLRDI